MDWFTLFILWILLFCGLLLRLSYAWEWHKIRKAKDFTSIMKLSHRQFEYRTWERMKAKWRTKVKVWIGKADGGIDVEGWKDGKYWYVQCKHYSPKSTIPVQTIRELYGTAMNKSKSAKTMFVATCGYTKPAQEEAAQMGMKLVGRRNIVDELL